MQHPAYVSKADPHTWRLKLWVQPRSKRNGLAGEYQACLKVRITSPPVDDKANSAVCAFIAEILGIKSHQVILESGHAGRQKT
ncbi:MAG: DUF167 domain-containing protein, partial [Desulfovibrionales bacterium]